MCFAFDNKYSIKNVSENRLYYNSTREIFFKGNLGEISEYS